MDASPRSLLIIDPAYLPSSEQASQLLKSHGIEVVAADQREQVEQLSERWAIEPSRRLLIVTGSADVALLESSPRIRTAVMADVSPALARRVCDVLRPVGNQQEIYFAKQASEQGVWDACRWFELMSPDGVFTTDRLGATSVSIGSTFFRVWAPMRNSVAVEWTDPSGQTTRTPLQRHASGDFSGIVAGAGPGTRYTLALDHSMTRPDPISRFQPNGVHTASEVVSPFSFAWTDQQWRGVPKPDLVIYEIHLGAWTEGGTFRAAIERLDELVELGVTAVELMPVAQSPGKWNWGYDGVCLYAPRSSYGRPDDLRALVDACHAKGLAVILDVVYNHLGPEGNYLRDFGPYFSPKHGTPWGEAFDFDGPNGQAVGRYVIQNALYWLDEYHLDGVRLDAVHFMFDDRPRSIMDEIRTAVCDYEASAGRSIHLIAEANIYDHDLAVGSDEHPAYSAIWCDDMMHSIYRQHVPNLRLTQRGYHGTRDLAEAVEHGYLYTGPQLRRTSSADRQQRHNDSDREYLKSLIVALQTHDAVGNHPHGKRIHQLTSRSFQTAAATLFLLHPAIPMIFMGEETATSAPFSFFVDFEDPKLRRRVDRGRAREYPQHQWKGALSPSDPEAFRHCQLAGAEHSSEVLAWYRSLIRLRHQWRQHGWLEPQYLTTDFDEASACYRLTYTPTSSDRLSVCVRLDDATADPITVSLAGHVRLDSLGLVAGDVEQITLQAQHAVIVG